MGSFLLKSRTAFRLAAKYVSEERGVGLKGWLSGPGRKGRRPESAPLTPLDRHRIAVLPLSNISPDPQDEYFADGMTEEVISTVSRVEGLEVISRTSVMQYKKAPKTVREVGLELDVGTILEGSVRKAGNKLRVTVQMIDAQRDRHLWSESYDRDLQDVFAIQSDIARQVAEALQVRLLPANEKSLKKSPTSNVEAYTLYLKAKPNTYRQDEESLRLAIGFFEQAIAKDPDFALAYTGLARAYSGLAFHGLLSAKEAGGKARKYAEKALSIDDSLAEAHLAMGTILRNFDWDLVGAEREFKRAIELNPSLAQAYGALGILLMFRRHEDSAVFAAERAIELDPLAGSSLGAAGVVYLYFEKYDKAIERFAKALQIDPGNSFARGNLGLSYVQKGSFEMGIREMEPADLNSTTGRADLAYAYSKAGRVEDLRRLLDRLLVEVNSNHELAYAIASAYANLDDHERALDWLEKAYSEHVTALIGANGDFVFGKISAEPRFRALMEKLGYRSPVHSSK
jgi:TolB-like protein/Flp pilus assembly protein TadD